MKHDLKSHPQGVTCAACGWVWKTEPVSPCPGLPRFNWWGAPFRPPPEHLKTAGQLYELGFSTGKSKLPVPAAVIRREKSEPHGWMYLYDPSQAAPRKTLTEAQRAHLDAAREKALSRWKCAICGSHLVGKEYWRGVCGGCELNAQLDADRDGAIRAARDLLAHPEGVIILDSETASMHGEIIELAIIDLTGKALFNRRFQPSSDIEPGAAAVHGLTAEILSQEGSTDLERAQKLLRRVRQDEEAGVLIQDPWKFDLLGSAGSKQFDVGAIIQRYESRIAMSMLATFLMLGMDKVGGSHLVGKEYWRGVCGECELNAQLDADRDGAIRAARDLLAHPEGVIILDSETASMHGEIIELAIIDLTGKALFNRRFQPSSDIEPGAAAVHGLTAEILSQEAGWPQLWPQIAGVLGAARLALIYNASYDLGCLTHTCHLHQVTPPTLRTDCLMEWYAQYVGEWSDYHRSYRWQRLPGGDHSALGDCRAGLDVLKAMAAATLKSERTKESLHAAKD